MIQDQDAEVQAGPVVPGDARWVESGADVPANPLAVSAPPSAEAAPIGFEFRGDAREYFKIWIVNLALTLMTLGIYSPWAKVRKLRYFYGNTYLDGSPFEFLGRPLAILKGRIIAAAAFGAYWYSLHFYQPALAVLLPVFAILFPWVVAKSLTFRARHSAYRNLTFSYRGSYWRVAWAYLGLPLLVAACAFGLFGSAGSWAGFGAGTQKITAEDAKSIGRSFAYIALVAVLVLPYFYYLQKRLFIAPRRFGDTPFEFECGPKGFYYTFLFGGLLGIVLLPVAFLLLAAMALFHPSPLGITIGNVVVFGLIELLLYSFFVTMLRNMIVSAVRVGDAKLGSDLRVTDVFTLYLTNILAMFLSLGLLTPWAKVRMLRYQMSRTRLSAPQGIAHFTGSPGESASAVGEELVDVFDLDLAI